MRNTIKKHQDFCMSDTDPNARSPFFIVRAKKAKYPNDPRIGFMATKRTFKLAVDRNRAKRLLRDWTNFCSDLMLPEYDYVFFARGPILNITRDMGRASMTRALEYIMRKYGNRKK